MKLTQHFWALFAAGLSVSCGALDRLETRSDEIVIEQGGEGSKNSNSGESGDQSDERAESEPVATSGTNLLTYENARILCQTPAYESGSDYLLRCDAAIENKDKSLVVADSVKKGVEIVWGDLVSQLALAPGDIQSCDQTNLQPNTLQLTCRLVNVAPGSRFGVRLNISESGKKRYEEEIAIVPPKPSWNIMSNSHNPSLPTGTAGHVNAMAVEGTNVYVGGGFPTAGGVTVNNIARWDHAASTWHSLGQGLTGYVDAMEIAGEYLYVSGSFFLPDGTFTRLTRWHIPPSTWHPFPSTLFNNVISSIKALGDEVFVAGSFTLASGNAFGNYIISWNGTDWRALGMGLNSTVHAIEVVNNTLYVGGLFTDAGSYSEADYVARWNPATNSWHALGSVPAFDVSSQVYSITHSGDDVFVGGYLVSSTAPTYFLARWNTTSQSWHTMGDGVLGYGDAHRLKADQNYLYSANSLKRWNLLTQTWENINGQGLNGPVYTMVFLGDEVYLGGGFTTAHPNGGAAIPVNYVTRFGTQAGHLNLAER